MKGIHQGIVMAVLLPISLVAAGCAGNRDAPVKALRAEANDLGTRLAQTESALAETTAERDQLAAANQELAEQIAGLEHERQQEIDRLHTLRDKDAAEASNRIRGLNATITGLRQEAAEREILLVEKDSEITEQSRTIGALNSSIEAYHQQLVTMERDKTSLAQQLQASKKKAANTTRGLGLLLVATVGALVAGVVRTRNRDAAVRSAGTLDSEAEIRSHAGGARR